MADIRGAAVIVGAGPGLGAALARAYGRAGHPVALVARSEDRLAELGSTLQAEGLEVGWAGLDVADAGGMTAAVQRFGEHRGGIAVVHHNASRFRPGGLLETDPEQLLADLAIGAVSMLALVAAARPYLSAGGRVVATGSGAADRPFAGAGTLGVQKAALRTIATTLDSELREGGVRAMSLTVRGTIAAGTPFDPDRIAARVLELLAAPEEDWQTEVAYDG